MVNFHQKKSGQVHPGTGHNTLAAQKIDCPEYISTRRKNKTITKI